MPGWFLVAGYDARCPLKSSGTDFGKALLLIQSFTLFRQRHPVTRFNFALITAVSCFLVALALFWHLVCANLGYLRVIAPTWQLVLTISQLACATLSCICCLSLPRRPTVFFESHAVDAQFSASALSRWTFSWAGQILTFAKHNYGLDMLHVPQLHLRVRASYLESLFNTKRKSNILWKDLIRAHRLELIGQWLLAATQGVVQFTPQLAMYKLLELLQRRSESEAAANRAWSWVAALGVAIVITAWLESYMMWVVWARMGSPIRSELSALIFCKSTRHKDVKGQQRSKTGRNTDMNIVTGAKDDDTGDEGPSFSAPPLAVPVDEESDEVVQRSRQSVINLIAIDAKRISTFAECHYIFVQTIAKLATSSYFLIRLIGWRSLLAGFAASALSLPLNVWVSNSYGKTQSRLMRARDQKMAVMTEALQGIRQIKFSALESQWHAWIGKRRAEEMVLQRKSFTLNSVLIGIWILGPVMLSAISLTVSAVLHGDLSPAIAFTTITIFGQIESTLAFIPELTSDGLGKWTVKLAQLRSSFMVY